MSAAKKVAAYESWYRTQDRTARTAAARKANLDKFEHQAAEDARAMGLDLSPEALASKAAELRRIHFTVLGIKSGRARRARSLKARIPTDGGESA
ncbi:hypothetical protein [Mycobacterium sp. RTGN5]|uniref:hypothetical protein n=1 Tax=Mycobacterium sp. RTGN5 TaxID=3016522 RepID=UPI0029C6D974|nr:hypothetical protein [Mycobacterium sp. RTGN5]